MEKLEEFKKLLLDRDFEIEQQGDSIFQVRLYLGNKEGYADFYLSTKEIEESVLDSIPLYNMYIKRFLEKIKNGFLIDK